MSEIEKILSAINALKIDFEGNIKKTEEIKDMFQMFVNNEKFEEIEQEVKR